MPSSDSLVAEIAAQQFDIFTRGQALRAGLPYHAVRARLKGGRWEEPLRGVYRISGVPSSPQQHTLAAVLAAGPGAAASHTSAAAAWGLLEWGLEPICVTVPYHRRALVAGSAFSGVAAIVPIRW